MIKHRARPSYPTKYIADGTRHCIISTSHFELETLQEPRSAFNKAIWILKYQITAHLLTDNGLYPSSPGPLHSAIVAHAFIQTFRPRQYFISETRIRIKGRARAILLTYHFDIQSVGLWDLFFNPFQQSITSSDIMKFTVRPALNIVNGSDVSARADVRWDHNDNQITVSYHKQLFARASSIAGPVLPAIWHHASCMMVVSDPTLHASVARSPLKLSLTICLYAAFRCA